MKTINYGPPTVQGLLSGDVTMIIDGVVASLPHIKSGRFRVLANLGQGPIAALPGLPTLAAEANLPGFDVLPGRVRGPQRPHARARVSRGAPALCPRPGIRRRSRFSKPDVAGPNKGRTRA